MDDNRLYRVRDEMNEGGGGGGCKAQEEQENK